ALAQKTVPTVYGEDEDEGDQTKVAPDDVMKAAIRASREPASERKQDKADQDAIDTVRPPPDKDAPNDVITAKDALRPPPPAEELFDEPAEKPVSAKPSSKKPEKAKSGDAGEKEDESTAEAKEAPIDKPSPQAVSEAAPGGAEATQD